MHQDKKTGLLNPFSAGPDIHCRESDKKGIGSSLRRRYYVNLLTFLSEAKLLNVPSARTCDISSHNFLDPRRRPEKSCKIGSVRSSFRLFVSFLGIGSVFSETYDGVRGSYIVVCDRVGFFGKNSHRAKNDQKWSEMAQKQGF